MAVIGTSTHDRAMPARGDDSTQCGHPTIHARRQLRHSVDDTPDAPSRWGRCSRPRGGPERQCTRVRQQFDECFVTGYLPLVPNLELPDPGDRHVLAAAIRCSAQVIVTENHKDFPPETLDVYGIETLSADDMLAYLGTWSAVRRAQDAGESPLDWLAPRLRREWGAQRRVVWPLVLRVGRLAG